MGEEFPDLDKLLSEEMWASDTVEEVLACIESANRFKAVFDFLCDQLRQAVGDGATAVSPEHASAVLLSLERKSREIDNAVSVLKNLSITAPTEDELAEERRKERERDREARKKRARALLARMGSKEGPVDVMMASKDDQPVPPSAPQSPESGDQDRR